MKQQQRESERLYELTKLHNATHPEARVESVTLHTNAEGHVVGATFSLAGVCPRVAR